MKQLLCALCASFILAPLSFARDSAQSQCDSSQKNQPTLAECGKCKKDGECDKDKKAEGKLAECGKCKKGEDDKKPEGKLV
ncbi:MAG: hypothetical protein WCJ14_11810 [Verrucomicrobiota bacterium]